MGTMSAGYTMPGADPQDPRPSSEVLMAAFEEGLRTIFKEEPVLASCNEDLSSRIYQSIVAVARKNLLGGANAYRMWRYRNDEDFRQRCLKENAAADKLRYHVDPEFRERKLLLSRQALEAKFGFRLSDQLVHVCKYCKQLAKAKDGGERCCDMYRREARGKKVVIYDMELQAMDA